MKGLFSLSVALYACLTAASSGTEVFKRLEKALESRSEAKSNVQQDFYPFAKRRLEKRSSYYLNNATQQFVVNGSAIPDVDFDIGESYAGLLPVSQAANETKKLFFWFFPSTNPNATDEITIWFNGGPGCSSLSGLLFENGPFTWMPGTFRPVQNPYTWVNLTNMLWVEQPVGVGFTQGTPDITDEIGLGKEFAGFYKNFVTAFGLQKRKVYLTGESYAGYYIPYIADTFINLKDKIYYNLAGVSINDPIIGDGTLQQEVPIVPYLDYWSNVFDLNATFTKDIHARADACNYTSYFNKYLTFPPPGPFPPTPDASAPGCDVFTDVFYAALEVNPCFNIYHILDTCPHLWSQLGIVNTGDYQPPGATVYFNRTDVQKAINAPLGTNWYLCTPTNVFGGASNNQNVSDNSLGPAQDGVLQHVIEYTNNAIIGVGNLDFLLATNGTLLALQNMTWNGLQGFQASPTNNEFYAPYHPEYIGGSLAGAGVLGSWGKERGLTFYQIDLAGHELPEYTPGAAYRMVEYMLGRVPSLSTPGDFTTQTGNFTGSSPLRRRGFEEMS